MIGRTGHYNVRTRFELTARQREVMDLVARGKTNGEIADALGITLDGVKWHVREILAKFEVESREEAAALWRERQQPLRRLGRALGALLVPGVTRWVAGGAGLVAVAGMAVGLSLAWSQGGKPSDVSLADAKPCGSDQLVPSIVATASDGDVHFAVALDNDGPPCIPAQLTFTLSDAAGALSLQGNPGQVTLQLAPHGSSQALAATWSGWCVATPGPFRAEAAVGSRTARTDVAPPTSCGALDGSTLTIQPAIVACDPAKFTAEVAAVDNPAGSVDITTTVHNDGPPCVSDGLQIAVRRANDDTSPDIARLKIFDIFGAAGSGTSGPIAWRNYCGGQSGPFDIIVNVGGKTVVTRHEHPPACEGPIPSASTLGMPVGSPTPTPMATPTAGSPNETFPAPTCDPSPPPLTLTTEDGADGSVLIHLHVVSAGCRPPDSDGVMVYEAGHQVGGAADVMYSGYLGSQPDITLRWKNGCDLVAPFVVTASALGARGSMTVDHGPRCDAPGSAHEGTITLESPAP